MQEENGTIVSFRSALAELLKQKNLTPTGLAREIGVSHVAINNYLSGRVPRAEILQKISFYFGVSSDALLSGMIAPRQPHESKKCGVELRDGVNRTIAMAINEARTLLSKKAIREGRVRLPVRYLVESEAASKVVELLRPDPREIRKLALGFEQEPDVEPVMKGCLPEKFRSDSTLNLILPESLFAMDYVAMVLVFGDDGPGKMRTAYEKQYGRDSEAKEGSADFIALITPPLR